MNLGCSYTKGSTTTTYSLRPIKAGVGGSNKIHPGNQAAVFWNARAFDGTEHSRRDRLSIVPTRLREMGFAIAPGPSQTDFSPSYLP